MRGFIIGLVPVLLASIMGCGEPRTSQREPTLPTGGVSMQPLTSPQPAPPMQGYPAPGRTTPGADPYAVSAEYAPPPSPYAQLTAPVSTLAAPTYSPPPPNTAPEPAYSGAEIYTVPDFTAVSPAYTSSSGQYCEVTDTTESSYVVPMVDPPIMIDGRATAYYPPEGQPSSAPVATPAYAPGIATPIYSPAITEPVYTPASAAPVLFTQASAAAAPGAFSPSPPAAGQLQLIPAPDIPPGNHPNDYGPSQWFEIVRPGNGPVRIGRVSSTCVCVGVRVPNRHVAAGQRALIEARLVARPPQTTVTYGLYVQIIEPAGIMLDADVTVSARR